MTKDNSFTVGAQDFKEILEDEVMVAFFYHYHYSKLILKQTLFEYVLKTT